MDGLARDEHRRSRLRVAEILKQVPLLPSPPLPFSDVIAVGESESDH